MSENLKFPEQEIRCFYKEGELVATLNKTTPIPCYNTLGETTYRLKRYCEKYGYKFNKALSERIIMSFIKVVVGNNYGIRYSDFKNIFYTYMKYSSQTVTGFEVFDNRD